MYPSAKIILCGVLIATSVAAAAAQNAVVERDKAEIVAKADSLFGQRYSPLRTAPLSYDKERESGPPDGVIYWFDTSYIVRLIFATDGSLARVEALPEALLYSDSWTSVEDAVELGQGELQWFINTVNQLRPTGDPVEVHEPPDACFQSGPNLYCHDRYKEAIASEYCREQYRRDKDRLARISLKSVTLAYKQPLVGTISDLNVLSANENRVKVGPLWYRILKVRDEKLFDSAVVGSVVSLTTFGCAANELVCEAVGADVIP
jgi:hypothetical protein